MIIKICGMRDSVNIRAVEQVGADWMGFICYGRSPRYVGSRSSYLPEKMLRIGVFVNETDIRVCENMIESLDLQGIQLHGNESPGICRHFRSMGLMVMKSFSVGAGTDFRQTRGYEDVCDYFLFDTLTSQYGGSGKSFDWNILKAYQGEIPFLLSGGLCMESLGRLSEFHHPRWAGIDLNSGFEISPGMKDAGLLAHFIKKIRNIYPETHSCF